MAVLEENLDATVGLALGPIVSRLDPYVAAWTDADITAVADFLKDWNSNARFSFVAQAVLSSLVRVHKRKRLEALRPVAMLFEGIMAYSQRHLDRVDRLQQASNLLEYATSSLALLPCGGRAGAGGAAHKKIRQAGAGASGTSAMDVDADNEGEGDDDEDDDEDLVPMAFFEGGHQAVMQEREQQESLLEEEVGVAHREGEEEDSSAMKRTTTRGASNKRKVTGPASSGKDAKKNKNKKKKTKAVTDAQH
jgi:hypothetical protein